ncbi:MAG TPA: FISUMP domain-containing protein [Tenuifilaceae bacterium]|nr:FISUMP domain-containing protein [Tenuifilaceae bacterium]
MKTKQSISILPLLIMGVFLVFASSCEKDNNIDITYSTMTDQDGNVYKTVNIGTQVWMAENLKTTKYADGTPIALVNTTSTWLELTETSKAYCWYNDDIANKTSYGALYTWAAAMNGAASTSNNPSGIQGVCPTGWHLPSDAEWTQMENYLANNGYNYDGTTGGGFDKIAKSLASTSGWFSSSGEGTVGNTDYPAYRNKSGFTALPGGGRDGEGRFDLVGSNGYWWSATGYYATYVWVRNLCSLYSDVNILHSTKDRGFSVRCVKD